MEDDYPVVECPKCRAEQVDLDGFGFVHCPKCRFCRHPHEMLESEGWRCQICGNIRPEGRDT